MRLCYLSVSSDTVCCSASLVEAVERFLSLTHLAWMSQVWTNWRSCFVLLLLLNIQKMSLASSCLWHKVLVWYETHVWSILNLLNVHLLLHEVSRLGTLMTISTTQSHTSFKLLLHLLEVDKLSLSLIHTCSRPFSLMVILLPAFHSLVALKLLRRIVGTCCCANATVGTHDVCKAL